MNRGRGWPVSALFRRGRVVGSGRRGRMRKMMPLISRMRKMMPLISRMRKMMLLISRMRMPHTFDRWVLAQDKTLCIDKT